MEPFPVQKAPHFPTLSPARARMSALRAANIVLRTTSKPIVAPRSDSWEGVEVWEGAASPYGHQERSAVQRSARRLQHDVIPGLPLGPHRQHAGNPCNAPCHPEDSDLTSPSDGVRRISGLRGAVPVNTYMLHLCYRVTPR